MRKALLTAGIALAVLVACVLALVLLIDVNQYRGRIQAELQKQLNRPVTLGKMGLRLFPLSVAVDNVVIGESPEFPSGRPFATVEQLRVHASVLPLLRKEVHVTSLMLSRPSIELVRNAAGKWNYSTLGAAGAQPAASPGEGGGAGFALDRLQLKDGSVAVTDLASKTARSFYNNIEATLSNLGRGKVCRGEVSLNAGKVPVSASGTLDTNTSVVDAKAKVVGANLADVLSLARAFGVDGVTGSGTVSLDGSVQGPLDSPNYSGGGSLENASLRFALLAKPLNVRNAEVRLNRQQATLSNLACSLGSSNMKGSVTVRNFAAPEAGFQLNIDKLDIDELQQAMKPQPSGGKGASETPARFSAKGTIDVGSIVYGGVTLNRVHSGCTLSHGVLTLDPLTAEAFGGKQSGRVVLDTRSQPATLALKSNLEGVDANRLLSATTSLKDRLYGLLQAAADARVTLAPGADIARTLNGTLSLRMTKGRLQGFNLMNEIASVGKFLGYQNTNQGATDITLLAGDLDVRDGVANTNNLRVDLDGGSVAAAGTVNLVSQAMNMRLTAVLNQAMSQKVGGNRIGGFLTTAFSNDKGELVIPAIASGPLAHPTFAPDPARIAGSKLKSLVPQGKPGSNPAQGIMDALGALRGKKK
ncbi:MAG: AsmA family protein [Acidobacteriota bacterium]